MALLRSLTGSSISTLHGCASVTPVSTVISCFSSAYPRGASQDAGFRLVRSVRFDNGQATLILGSILFPPSILVYENIYSAALHHKKNVTSILSPLQESTHVSSNISFFRFHCLLFIADFLHLLSTTYLSFQCQSRNHVKRHSHTYRPL